MAKQFKLRRGTTAEHSTFIGASAELTVDTTKKTAVVHDGATPGGAPLAREDLSNVRSAILNAVYPIGSIYINAGVTTNPATLLGFGTWAAFGAGRVMVGLSGSDTLFDTPEETGGSKDAIVVAHSHTITSTEMAGPSMATDKYVSTGTGGQYNTGVSTSPAVNFSIDSTGSSGANANLQPYITVAMWKRTA